MSALELLEALHDLGITARVEGDNLKLYPARLLDSDLLEDVRTHKAELLELLGSAPTSDTARHHNLYRSAHCGLGCIGLARGRSPLVNRRPAHKKRS